MHTLRGKAVAAAAAGMLMAAGVGAVQPARAAVRTQVWVSCSWAALSNAIANASNGEELGLNSRHCVYEGVSPLPPITKNITINGRADDIVCKHSAVFFCAPVLRVTSGAHVKIMNLSIERSQNLGLYCGGGLYAESGTTTLEGTFFIGNSANEGGGLCVGSHALVRLRTFHYSANFSYGNQFRDNYGHSRGGGIMVQPGGRLDMQDANFYDNRAPEGAAVYNAGAAAATSSSFSDNHARSGGPAGAAGSGGAIYNDGTLKMSGGSFDANTAAWGGALFNKAGHADLTNAVIFDRNTAGDGGGIYAANGNVTAEGDLFTSNQAADGGAVFDTSAHVTLLGSQLNSNVPDNCYPVASVASCAG